MPRDPPLARHAQPSAVFSADDDPGRPADELIALTTFDVVPWERVPVPALRPADFADGRLRQVVGEPYKSN